ncbi:hypothetical protein NEDG_01996 [Nematocida displodere]|uniref:GIT Spa2 homology (SHD) domain-containing protein n=1 Tax=Nematocida displodere TaxID=1805483 RepID=A0A177EER6_9MICR|nr:hypothetical protein NEDG_01996 [Nematocida displodere]
MDLQQRESATKKRKAFEAFLGKEPNIHPEGKKKEAVEKIFFFSDEQFSEICEDLFEEIDRRQGEHTHALAPVPEYSAKRNAIRGQLSYLERAEMHSLVEDTLLVLRHKHPLHPGDRLECLNQLVEDLQQIVASNTPIESPATHMKNLDRARQRIDAQPDFLSKTEAFLGVLPETIGDPSPQVEEILGVLRESITRERKRSQHQIVVVSDLSEALAKVCNASGCEAYLQQIKAHATIEDHEARKRALTQEAIKEFIRQTKEAPAPTPSQEARPVEADPLNGAIRRLTDIFEEIEQCISHPTTFANLRTATLLLSKERPGLIAAVKASFPDMPNCAAHLANLPVSISVNKEEDALSVAELFYSAVIRTLEIVKR